MSCTDGEMRWEKLEQVQFSCSRHGLRAALHVELPVNDIDIPFHCADGQYQTISDFAIGVSFSEQP